MCSRHRPENGADSGTPVTDALRGTMAGRLLGIPDEPLPFDNPPDDDAEPWNDELAVWENDDDAQAS